MALSLFVIIYPVTVEGETDAEGKQNHRNNFYD